MYGGDINYNLEIKNSVLFAPYNKSEFDLFVPLINEVLPFYRVILRSRMVCEKGFWDSIYDIFEKPIKEGLLVIDDSGEISEYTYFQSFVLVCGATTSKFTFPLLSGSPCMVIGDFKIDSSLGFVLEDSKFLENIHKIYENKYEWCKKITEHREYEIYNFGNASEYLSNFILDNII